MVKIIIFGVAVVVLVVLFLAAKAVHTAAMFMDDSFRWENSNEKIGGRACE